jgi:L-2-hydroxyglutarate oxidase LhgO
MSYQADITIIGAGVVGLAVASEVAKGGRDVYVLEKNDGFGQEQSSRNSEVIHAGIYYEPGSLKTQLCLEGNRLLYELCEQNGIAYHSCGKIIVATDQVEAEELEKLYNKGRENGAPLQMLSQKEMGQMEPNMKGVAAFFAPTTGIIDSHGLMRYFLARARGLGAQIAYKTEAVAIEKASAGYEIGVKGASQESSFISRVVINCGGLHSGKVSQIAGIDVDEAKYRLNWCKGEFYSVAGGKNRLVNRLIYPVPMAISVGVHVCLDVEWKLRLGPLFYYVNKLDYRIDDSRRKGFLESSMMKALPFLKPSDLEPESSGIMAMLQGEGESFHDFVIKHEIDRGLPGFINLVGIETPGLTSSPAIARYVARLVDEIL